MTDTDVTETIQLAPDGGLVKSLGAHHTLESALADLVDNAIDADAGKVLVRLLTQNSRLARVEVLDDGAGMDQGDATKAMTIGHRRDYVTSDLGHFGMGLKAASFAHADILTVWSQRDGMEPVGRRIVRADFSHDFSCEVLSTDRAAFASEARSMHTGMTSGTSVVWTGIRHGYRGTSKMAAVEWLDDQESKIRIHLGVVFHRLIASGLLQIHISVDEIDSSGNSLAVPVSAIDPFGYPMSGHPDYPKTLVASVGDQKISMTAHVWPAKKDITGFRIGDRNGEKLQGFFIYRNDRLLHAGSWADTAVPARERQLARVVLDDPEAIRGFVTMNSEKQGVRFQHAFHEAVSRAVSDDGTGFEEFLADAEQTYTTANKRRVAHRKPAITPGRGFAPKLRKTFESELPLIQGEEMHLRWKNLPEDDFIDIDFPERVLYLNARYRALFAPARSSLNDAPVVKALLYLLTHEIYEGQILGARDKDQIELWKVMLGAAVMEEAKMREVRQS
ncbi:ATP-binding protein [Kocuria sp. CPCC 205263]|uniref:ATP-binding protein n=1 Tax=Kocuria sp. CPCC 205263 TaxID=3073555 RepID=UPI0034D72DC9